MNRSFRKFLVALSKAKIVIRASDSNVQIAVANPNNNWKWGVQYGEVCNTPDPKVEQ